MKLNVPDSISSMWIAVGLFWLVAALNSKRKRRVETSRSRLIEIALLALAFALLFKPQTGYGFFGWRFLPDAAAAHDAGLAITAAGLLLALFARVCLGRNWSGVVAIKEDHELIRHGPYAWVRHPIYSGLLLAFLGSAIAFGEFRCLLGLALAIYRFWRKSRLEERFLIDQFGPAYLDYRLAVKALIPFIL